MPRHLAQARTLLRLPAQRKVVSLLEGEYAAVHLGRSTEFNDLREYVRGDDPKDLDWKASARARTLLVRRYEALRRLNVLLVMSTGRSLAGAASGEVMKRDLAVAVAGLVGALALRHGDAVGLVHGDSRERISVPRRGGRAHVERCLDAAWSRATPDAAASDLGAVLREVARSVRSRCFVVVISDQVGPDPEVLTALRRLRVQHEIVMVVLEGLSPTDVPASDRRSVRDVDLGAEVPGWLRRDPRLGDELGAVRARERADLESALDGIRVAHVHVSQPDGVLPALRLVFERHRRVGRG